MSGKFIHHWTDAHGLDEIKVEANFETGKFYVDACGVHTITDHARRRAMSIDQLRRTRAAIDQAIAFLEQAAAETVAGNGAAL